MSTGIPIVQRHRRFHPDRISACLWLGLVVLVIAPNAEGASRPRFTNFETGANVKSLAFEGPILWMGLSNGIIRYDTRTDDHYQIFTNRSTGGGLLSNGIYKIFVDRSGVKWVGTYGGGLSRFDGKRWKTFTPFGGGSTDYGIGWIRYSPSEGLGDLWVYDMLEDREGTLWIATWKGVSRLSGDRFFTYTVDDGLIDPWVYALVQDRQGAFWFGTEGGVSRFDGENWVSFTHADGLGAPVETPVEGGPQASRHHQRSGKSYQKANPNFVLSLVVDRENVAWIGTWGAGLSRFDGKRWKTYTRGADSIGGNFVHALALDPQGRLFAATDGGISVYEGGRWSTFTTRDGLIDNNVFSIAFDADGNCWLGTWTGLSKMQWMEHPSLP